MRRFTDSVLFIALFALDALAWLILTATGGIEAADPTRIAPMTVGTVVVIACPALLLAAVIGLVRALAKGSPKTFYMWSIVEAVVAAACVALANVVTNNQGPQVGFGWMAWFFGILALAFVVAFIIALTGGISGPEDSASATTGRNAAEAAEENSSKKHHLPHAHRGHDEAVAGTSSGSAQTPSTGSSDSATASASGSATTSSASTAGNAPTTETSSDSASGATGGTPSSPSSSDGSPA